ncbi:MAG: hypothetical protein ABIK73_08975 [candidate division WOR-3 bacterium]
MSNIFDLYAQLSSNPRVLGHVKLAQESSGTTSAVPADATPRKADRPPLITDEEIKVPKNVANVLAGVILGLLATKYLSGREEMDVQTAIAGGGLGGLLGLLGPDFYQTSLKPALSTLLGIGGTGTTSGPSAGEAREKPVGRSQ